MAKLPKNNKISATRMFDANNRRFLAGFITCSLAQKLLQLHHSRDRINNQTFCRHSPLCIPLPIEKY